MLLTFPTLAEQAVEQFKSSTKTISFSTIAKTLGAFRDDQGTKRVWVFPDDTTLELTGVGKYMKIETHLP